MSSQTMNENIQRYIVVAVGCCVVINAGFFVGLIAAENDIKHFLSLSQKQGMSFCLYTFCLYVTDTLISVAESDCKICLL